MPNGEVHFALWKKYWIATIPAIAILVPTGSVPAIVGVLIGYGLGAFITPDLDLIGISSDEARMMRTFKIFGALMVSYWFLYAYTMRFVGIGRKGHRNFFSHFPGVSTAPRMVYAFWAPALLIWWYYLIPAWLVAAVAGAFAGLTIADAIHYIADMREKS